MKSSICWSEYYKLLLIWAWQFANFRGAGGDDNKNRKPLAVLRLSSVDTAADDVDMNVEPASKRDDQVMNKKIIRNLFI